MVLDRQRRMIARSGWTTTRRLTLISTAVPALILATSPPGTAGAAPVPDPAATTTSPVTAEASPALGLHHPIAVGLPDLGPGLVSHYLPSGGVQLLTESAVGLGNHEPLTRFGAAVAVVDLDQDGYFDLIVGAPGNSTEKVAGRVDLLFGTPTGITSARALSLPSPGALGDDFGAALAVSTPNPYRPEAVRSLWIGAPGSDVGTHAKAGAVYRYSLSPSGELGLVDTVTQDSPLVPGASETGDRFGEVLIPDGGNAVVGVPHEDIGSAVDAGAVQRLRTAIDPDELTRTAPLIAGSSWDQQSPGVPGTAEAGDRFGAALSPSGYVVGVPGEDLGRRENAGIVQLFTSSSTDPGAVVPGPARSQDSPGVPGAAEAGDQFGASLSQGWYTCVETDQTAVGAPGEDLSGQADAGSVTVFRGLGCPATVLSQGRGLPGRAEAGDRVGSTLATATGDLDLENNRLDALLIGAPGEDIRTTVGTRVQNLRDAGRVMVWGSITTGSAFGFPGGDRTGLRYGTVLSSELN